MRISSPNLKRFPLHESKVSNPKLSFTVKTFYDWKLNFLIFLNSCKLCRVSVFFETQVQFHPLSSFCVIEKISKENIKTNYENITNEHTKELPKKT